MFEWMLACEGLKVALFSYLFFWAVATFVVSEILSVFIPEGKLPSRFPLFLSQVLGLECLSVLDWAAYYEGRFSIHAWAIFFFAFMAIGVIANLLKNKTATPRRKS